MRGKIFRAEVSLGFDDAADAAHAVVVAHEVHADELARDYERVSSVELAREPAVNRALAGQREFERSGLGQSEWSIANRVRGRPTLGRAAHTAAMRTCPPTLYGGALR